MALIFYLSSQTIDELQERGLRIALQDKLQHLIAYALLALLLAQALAGRWLRFPTTGQAIVAVLIASLYGASDEFHQSFVPTRHPEFGDWIADTAGALLALLGWALLRRINTRSEQKS